MTAPTAPEGPTLTVHGVLADGRLTESMGTAHVLTPDAVTVSGLANLPLPLVVVAPPEALVSPTAGRPTAGRPTVGGRELEVVTVHIGSSLPGPDEVAGARVALEFDEAVLVVPPEDPMARKPARSVLCLLFPRLQACRPRP